MSVLFSIRIQSKYIKHDDGLYSMENTLICYPLVHKESLFNYLMTDKYYYASNLYKTMGSIAGIICMNKIGVNNRNMLILEEERIFREKDIIDMFDYFKRNNFREKHVCGYVLPNQ